MRLLHITPEAPGFDSGGRLGVLQTELSITVGDNIVDYIGPPIDDENLKSRYNRTFFPAKTHNPIVLLINTLKGITNKSYNSWKKMNIDYKTYDYVVLDFTKQNYVLEKIDDTKLVVRVHNVEYDFSRQCYKLNKTIKNYIQKIVSEKQERCLLNAAYRFVPLTIDDQNRIYELYDINPDKSCIVPVCVCNHTEHINDLKLSNVMIITGSLWFGGNYDGIKWFLNTVFPSISVDCKLIIAGKNPNEELKSIISQYKNIELYENPSDMSEFFSKASLAIAPVFNGAGMKVKVAEALSYGIPVLGTHHALIGYNIKSGANSFEANTSQEFITAINNYFSLSELDMRKVKNQALELYQTHYSMMRSETLWKEILSN